MNEKDFIELGKHYDKTYFKEMESAFKEAVDKYIEHVDSQHLNEKEKLSKLLTFTYKEAFKASFMASVVMKKGVDPEA
ncbi:hypothetical protein [Oceanobacillus profundus]|uniref:hypothetical protein n=1 Tax=Oceanobacillus profundus TaxID=372463 RepID=UPI0026E20671|nr:hypothetical protein [Oceanobacillus profundus]MDO6451713.1 hypothetical protein [Oceanobacillus profundus]